MCYVICYTIVIFNLILYSNEVNVNPKAVDISRKYPKDLILRSSHHDQLSKAIFTDVIKNISRVNNVLEDLIKNYEKLKNLYKSQESLSDYSTEGDANPNYKQKKPVPKNEAEIKTSKRPDEPATAMFFSEEANRDDELDVSPLKSTKHNQGDLQPVHKPTEPSEMGTNFDNNTIELSKHGKPHLINLKNKDQMLKKINKMILSAESMFENKNKGIQNAITPVQKNKKNVVKMPSEPARSVISEGSLVDRGKSKFDEQREPKVGLEYLVAQPVIKLPPKPDKVEEKEKSSSSETSDTSTFRGNSLTGSDTESQEISISQNLSNTTVIGPKLITPKKKNFKTVKKIIQTEEFSNKGIWNEVVHRPLKMNTEKEILYTQRHNIFFRNMITKKTTKSTAREHFRAEQYTLLPVMRTQDKFASKPILRMPMAQEPPETTTKPSDSVEDNKVILKEQFKTRILRKAYGDACLKVVVKKCYKACKAAFKSGCRRYNCKGKIKNTYDRYTRIACIKEFGDEKPTNTRTKVEMTTDKDFQDITRNGYLAAACLPNSKTAHSERRFNNLTHGSHDKQKFNILRDRFEKACQELSSEKCTHACEWAVKEACSTHGCKSGMDSALKKGCKSECKSAYKYGSSAGRKSSDSSGSDSSGSGSSGSSGSGSSGSSSGSGSSASDSDGSGSSDDSSPVTSTDPTPPARAGPTSGTNNIENTKTDVPIKRFRKKKHLKLRSKPKGPELEDRGNYVRYYIKK